MNPLKSKNKAWYVLAAGLLVVFTILKLPPLNLDDMIEGHIQNAMSAAGIEYEAKETKVSLLLGPSISFKEIFLDMGGGKSLQLDELEITPSILSILTGTLGLDLELKKSKTVCEADVALDFGGIGGILDLSKSRSPVSELKGYRVDIEAKKFDIGEWGVLENFANVSGSGLVDLDGWVEMKKGAGSKDSKDGDKKAGRGKSRPRRGSMPLPQSGELKIQLSKLMIDEQSVYGFKLPSLQISEGQLVGKLQAGKLNLQKVELGKQGDDIVAKLDGNIELESRLMSSKLDLTANFSLSDKVMKSSRLLEPILKSAQKPDGSYAYQLTGRLGFPTPKPLR